MKNLFFILSQVLKGFTITRACHHFILNDKELKGNIADLGSSEKKDYYNYFKEVDQKNITFYDLYPKSSDVIKQDLEQKLNIKDEIYDNIILFNTLEHLKNYRSLLCECQRVLKKNSKLHIFVPFMYRYHPDPEDYLRFTHIFLKDELEKIGFEVKIKLAGTGPMYVISEIILKYLKFKIFFIPIFVCLYSINKLIKILSKDFSSYYLGIYCECKKK